MAFPHQGALSERRANAKNWLGSTWLDAADVKHKLEELKSLRLVYIFSTCWPIFKAARAARWLIAPCFVDFVMSVVPCETKTVQLVRNGGMSLSAIVAPALCVKELMIKTKIPPGMYFQICHFWYLLCFHVLHVFHCNCRQPSSTVKSRC